jgi:ferritin-like metal-binding protein YciE
MANSDPEQILIRCLQDAAALERISLKVLEQGAGDGEDTSSADIYGAHAQQTRGHCRLLDERLNAHGADPGGHASKSGANVAGLRVSLDSASGADAAQLAIRAFTVENLEIGLYQLLVEVARNAHDLETENVARQILEQEEDAAELVAGRIDAVAVARDQR